MAFQMTTVKLDKSIHTTMRKFCDETGMKMKGVINKALLEFFAREAAKQSSSPRSRNA